MRRHPCRRLLALAAVLALSPRISGADAEGERRAKAGLKVFPSLLAADAGLLEKAEPAGDLLVVILYTRDRAWADELAAVLGSGGADGEKRMIRDRPVAIELSSDFSLATHDGRPVSGVFVAEAPSDRELRTVIDWGIAHHTIVFSPFEGHVEQGVLGGISIGARVEPFINGRTLAAAGISIKDFYKKVARIIE